MSEAEFKEVEWLLMLIPFGVVLGTGFFFLFCSWRRACLKTLGGSAESNYPPAAVEADFNFHPTLFEQPSRWLAIQANDPALVQAALRLHHPTPCSCEEGLMEAREDKLFISPSIAGWVLVAGSGLPGPEDVDDCFHFLSNLSRKLGLVQFFSASRVVYQHAWVLMDKGRIYRAYAWAGETLWNQGPLTAAERELGLCCFEYGSEQEFFSVKDQVAANSEKVVQLAARWGLNPSVLGGGASKARGIVGALFDSHLG